MSRHSFPVFFDFERNIVPVPSFKTGIYVLCAFFIISNTQHPEAKETKSPHASEGVAGIRAMERDI